MKKTIMFLLVLTVGVLVFAGGQNEKASNTPEEQKAVELVVWGGVPGENGPDEAAAKYSAMNENVNVKYVRYVNDDQGNVKLDTALVAGEKIDVIIGYSADRLKSRVDSGLLVDLKPYADKNDVDLVQDFGGIIKPYFNENGSIYAIPTNRWMNLMLVNKDRLNAAGYEVPEEWTWDDVREISAALTEGEGQKKKYGYFLNPKPMDNIDEWMRTKYNRASWLNNDASKSTFATNPDFANALQWFYDMMYVDKSMIPLPEVVSENLGKQEANVFFGGKAAIINTGSHFVRHIKNTDQYPRDFVTAFAPAPKISDNQDRYYAPIIPNDDVSITTNSANPNEAFKFIKWYYREGFDPMIAGGRLPLYSGYDLDRAAELIIGDDTELFDKESLKRVMLGSSEYTVTLKSTKAMAQISDITKEEFERYLFEVQDLATTIENLQKRADEVLESVE